MNSLPPNARDRSAFARATISQEILQEYAELQRQQLRLGRLRKEILALLDEGAEVEPGLLTVRRETATIYRITRRSLTEVMGLSEEEVEEIRFQSPPVVQDRLQVRPADTPSRRGRRSWRR